MQTLNGEILITALQKISGCTPNRFAQYLGTTNKTVQDWIDRATGKKHGFMKNMSELWNPNKLLELLIEFKKKRFGGDNDKITRALLKALKGLQIDIQKYEETYEQQCKERANAAEVLWELLFEEAEAYYDRFYRPAGERKEDQGDSTWCPIKNHAQARLDKQCFRGREQLLADISERLEQHKNSPIFLWGVGGIGKTALACHFAVYEAKKYQVFFTTYSNSFKETIAKLELRNPDGGSITSSNMTVDQRYEIHMQALRKCTANIVLIIDNADSGTDLTRQDEYSELCLLDMQFIITTRNNMQGDGRALYVGELHPDDCIELMIGYYPSGKNSIDKLREIAEVLQYHTLTIDLIAKSMEESYGKLTPNKVLDLLKSTIALGYEMWEPVRRVYGPDESEKQAVEHLNTVFRMASITTEERHILGCFALANESFDNNELTNYWNREQIGFIKKLYLRGWLLKNAGVYLLHPVIRQVILLNREECMSWISNKAFILASLAHINLLDAGEMGIINGQSRATNIVENILEFMDTSSIENTYLGLLYCCYLQTRGIVVNTIDARQLEVCYNAALRCYNQDAFERYFVYRAYMTAATNWYIGLPNDSTRLSRRMEIIQLSKINRECRKLSRGMRCFDQESLMLSSETRAFLQRKVTMYEQCRGHLRAEIEKKFPKAILSFKQLLSSIHDKKLCVELSMMHWMLGNPDLELEYAQKARNFEENDEDIWAYECASLHNTNQGEGVYRDMLTAIEERLKKYSEWRGNSYIYEMSFCAMCICKKMGDCVRQEKSDAKGHPKS